MEAVLHFYKKTILEPSREGRPALKMIVLTCQHINRLVETYLGQL